MPQVPYSPVPEAQPSTQATPTQHLDKKQAFGQNVGAGLERVADGMARMAQGADALARGQEKLAAGMGEEAVGYEKIARGHEKLASGQAQFGKALEGAGTEIFGRAMLLQNVVNDADAREATTAYSMKVSNLYAEYGSKRGKDAFQSFEGFQKALIDLRKEHRDALQNPAAQKLYDSESQGTMTRTLFAGASHAKNQVKQFNSDTLKAEVQWLQNEPFKDPKSPEEFAIRQNDLVAAVTKLGINDHGLDPTTDKDHSLIKTGVLLGTSTLRANWLSSMAKTEPYEADKYLKTYEKDLIPSDYKRIEQEIRTQSRSLGAAVEGERIWTEGMSETGPDGKPKARMPLADMLKVADTRARELDPNDPLLPAAMKAAVQANWNRGRQGETAEKIDLNKYIVNRVYSGIKDEREFNLDPQAVAAVKRLHELGVRVNPAAMINNANAEKNRETNLAHYETLYNMMAGQPGKFVTEDLKKYNLRPDHQLFFFKRQLDLAANPVDDPKVTEASRVIINSKYRGELTQYGVIGPNFNQNNYNKYIGGLQMAYYQWQKDNDGKAPNPVQIMEQLAPMVLDRIPEKGFFGGDASKPIFQQTDVKSVERFKKWETVVRQQIKDLGGAQPTKHAMEMIWLGHEIKRLYGKKPKEAGVE